MIRLTALLCAGIFMVLLIVGQDNGQVRQGLMAIPAEATEIVLSTHSADKIVAEPETVATQAVFVPAQPVMVTQPTPEPVAVVEPEPAAPAEIWAYVDARSVNVRAGPSTDDAVIGRLENGEAVLVVAEDVGVDGWVLVRIEGDGIEGFVAQRFLTPEQP
ncbi:MAG: SH3 domain-containing protein [Paracoccaceae bacterium]